MSDKIIGTAVLDATKGDADTEILHLLCLYPDGTKHHSSIPVHPRNMPAPRAGCWTYEISGTSLNVSPSLRITTTRPSKANPAETESVELFHNDGAWTVAFWTFIPGGEYQTAYDLFRSLNGLETR